MVQLCGATRDRQDQIRQNTVFRGIENRGERIVNFAFPSGAYSFGGIVTVVGGTDCRAHSALEQKLEHWDSCYSQRLSQRLPFARRAIMSRNYVILRAEFAQPTVGIQPSAGRAITLIFEDLAPAVGIEPTTN